MAEAPMAEALSMCSLSSCTSTEIRNNSGKHLHQLQLERLMAAGELSEATTRKVLRLCCAHFKDHNSCGKCGHFFRNNANKKNKKKPVGDKALARAKENELVEDSVAYLCKSCLDTAQLKAKGERRKSVAADTTQSLKEAAAAVAPQHDARAPDDKRARTTMWTEVYELFLTQFKAGEFISLIASLIRAIITLFCTRFAHGPFSDHGGERIGVSHTTSAPPTAFGSKHSRITKSQALTRCSY
jgi:hypothetical protein